MSRWKSATLGDLIEIRHGFAFKGEFFSDQGPAPILVTPGNFAVGGGFQSTKAKYYLGPIPDGYTLERGDLVVTMTDLSKAGDTLGYSAVIPSNGQYLHNQRIGLVSITQPECLSRAFLYFVLRTPAYRQHVLAGATGSTVRHTSPSRICSYVMQLPSLSEQTAIAEVLVAIEDKIAVNESTVRFAHELSKLHFQLAMTQGSVTAAVGDVAAVFDGPHATPEKTGSGPWFLSISSLQGGRLVLSESAHLGEQDFARWTRRVTPMAGDVLFSYETRLGEAALMPDGVRACLGRRMALLRPRIDVVGPRTLLQAYLGEPFQETIRQRAVHGATVDRIPLTELPAWPITVPEGAGRLEGLLGAMDDMATQRERENETLAALRETLLPKLMSGQIRVRDAARVLEEAL